MPFCKKCGTSIAPDAAFCEGCGTPVSKTNHALPVVPPPLPLDSKGVQLNAPTDTPDAPTMVRNTPSYGAVNLEDLPVGHVIDDRYEVKVKLGQGGFGAVYRAHDRSLGIDKALKVIPAAVGHDFEAMMNLRAETKAMITLNHPAIVRVYDFHESGPIKYIDMEFIEGKSLSQIKAESPERKLPEKQVLDYARQISEGMAHAHEHNIIHRDLKPQNVLVTNGGRVKVLDFGIAQTLHTSMSRLRNTTSSGTLVYMSPEQIRGLDVGKESDIYSFGAVLYELLSGRPPFWQGDIQYQILNEQPRPITGVSEATSRILMQCLAKDFRARYRCFDEIFTTRDHSGTTQGQERVPVQDNCTCGFRNHAKAVFCEQCGKRIARPCAPGVSVNGSKHLPVQEEMVFIPGGKFMMGSRDIGSDERPMHEVEIGGFFMSKYEVTQQQYEEVMGNNPSRFRNCPDCPVENVSWNDAVEFCKRIGGRLPTEAEWEYACRAGSTTKYYWGEKMDGSYAWYDGNSGAKTHPVGQKRPNAFGLYDMSGNVWEWCSDWYGRSYYSSSPSCDPKGPSSGRYRVLRGGSWYSNENVPRSASRYSNLPDLRYSHYGFRCVVSR